MSIHLLVLLYQPELRALLSSFQFCTKLVYWHTPAITVLFLIGTVTVPDRRSYIEYHEFIIESAFMYCGV
jgi:hypothetical protein